MTILHIISSGGMYGAEAVILDLSRGLQESGHKSRLAVFTATSGEQTEFKRRAAQAGIETHELLCAGQFDRSVPARIRELLQRTEADIVHAHGYKADVYVFCALRGRTTPLVSTCHTWYDNDLALRLYGIVDRFVLKRFAAVIAVSREVKDTLIRAGVPKGRVHLIRNGVGTGMYGLSERNRSERTSDHFVVGLVGRLAPEKGVDLFLRAAAIVRRTVPEARFVVAGDGPDRAGLETLRDELGLGLAASLAGRQENMPGFLASLDLLVSASRQEGLPIALLEGMASGLSVVATRVGEVPEVVVPGVTGVLVSPGNPEQLAAAIADLLRDRDRRAAMGQASRLRVAQEFSAERMTADYLDVYETVLAGVAL